MKSYRSIISISVLAAWFAGFAPLAAQDARSQSGFSAAIGTLTATPVSEGSFNAIASPWATAADSRRTDLGHFSGSAFVVKSGTSYTVLLCQSGLGGGIAMTIVFSQTGSSATANPDFTLPDSRATITIAGPNAGLGVNPTGYLKISLYGNSVGGVARLKYAQAKLPGSTATEPVDVGISFRAPLQDVRQGKKTVKTRC